MTSPEDLSAGARAMELLPCPFCGGEASSTGHIKYSRNIEAWFRDGTPVKEAFFVNCVKCSCDNKGFIGHQTSADAINAWNTRSALPDHTGELVEERMRKCLEQIEQGVDAEFRYGTFSINFPEAEAFLGELQAKARARMGGG